MPIIASQDQPGYKLLQKGNAALVYVDSGGIRTKFGDEDLQLKVYLLNNQQGLVKEFVLNSYRCEPVIGIIRDYFLLYDFDSNFMLYDFDGRLVKQVKYDFEMLHSLQVIDSDYFLVRRWIWHPFFMTDIYNLNDVLADSVDSDDEEDSGYVGIECYSGTSPEADISRYTRDWCVESEKQWRLIMLESERRQEQQRLAVMEDFCKAELWQQLFRQDRSSKHVVFEGDSSEHSKLLEQRQVNKLSCIGGLSGADFDSHLTRLVKFEIPTNFHLDMILLLGYKLSDYADQPTGSNDASTTNSTRRVMTPLEIDQIIIINGSHRVRIKNTIVANMISGDQLNYENFQPWLVTFSVD